MRKSGIYKITNKVNGMVYIGQTNDLCNRECGHLSALRKGKHHNEHLQFAFNKYGEENFMFSLVEECDESMLDRLETFWIKQYKSTQRGVGYNKDGGGKANRNVSLETRGKLRDCFEGEKSRTATITEKEALYIIELLLKGGSIHGIAKELGISHKIVEAIRIKKTWKYLTANIEFPKKQPSSKYIGVTTIKTANLVLYRTQLVVNRKIVYKKCWDTEYDAAVAREVYIREHNIEGVPLNFPEDMLLEMPKKKVHGASKYYGVCRQVGTNHWVATVCNTYIGSFKTQLEAAIAREKYIEEHNIKSARHNHI